MAEVKCNPGIHSILNSPEHKDSDAAHLLRMGQVITYVRTEDRNISRTEFPAGAIIDRDCTTDEVTLIWHDGRTEGFKNKEALKAKYPRIPFMKERPVERTPNLAHVSRSARGR